MPSPVPAGYTRGPILFMATHTGPTAEEKLLQRFWQEAGAYGSRIVVFSSGAEGRAQAERARALFLEWESDSVTAIAVESRADGLRGEAVEVVQGATAILLCSHSALRLASVLGGTPLAQAIRRANAQNKAVGAMGNAANILCQHMLVAPRPPAEGSTAPVLPFLHGDMLQFAPGLGLVNRLVLDTRDALAGGVQGALGRLMAAVAYNPFLAAAGLEPDTGIVIYPNAAMEVFGDRNVLVVDGAQMQQTDLHEAGAGTAVSLLGVQLHVLALGNTFNFDTRVVSAPAEGDLPLQSEAVKAAF